MSSTNSSENNLQAQAAPILFTLTETYLVSHVLGDPDHIIGISKKETLQQNILSLIPDNISQKFAELLENARATGYASSKLNLALKDHEYSTVWQCFWDEDSSNYTLTGNRIMEVDEREAILNLFFTQSPLPKIIYDHNTFEVKEVNHQAEKVFGISREDFLKKNMADIRPPAEVSYLKERHNSIEQIDGVIKFGKCNFINSAGDEMVMDVTGHKVKYDNCSCVVTIYRDITEEENTTREQLEIGEEYKSILNSMTNYLVKVSAEGSITYANNGYQANFAQEGETVIGQYGTHSVSNDADILKLHEVSRQCLANPGKIYKVELEKTNNKGEKVYTYWELLGVSDSYGNPLEVQCMGMDISDVYHTRKELQQSNDKFQLLNDASKDAIYEWNAKTNDLQWGVGLKRNFGYDQLTFDEWLNAIHTEDRAEIKESLDEFLRKGTDKPWHKHYRLLTAKGTYAHVEEIGFLQRDPFNEPERIVGVLRNITETRMLERLLDDVSKISKLGAFEYYPDEDKHVWTPLARQIFGFSEDEEISLDKLLRFVGRKRKEVVQEILQKLTIKPDKAEGELLISAPDGTEKWLYLTLQSEIVGHDRIRMFGSFQDITARKNSEIALKSITNNLPGVIFQYRLFPDGHDELNYVSPKALDIWGHTADEVMKDTNLVWEGIRRGGHLQEAQEAVMKSAESLRNFELVIPHITTDGQKHWHHYRGVPRTLADGSTLWNTLCMDVSGEFKAWNIAQNVTDIAKIGSWEAKINDGEIQSIFQDHISKALLETDSKESLSEKELYRMVDRRDLTMVQDWSEKLLTKESRHSVEFRIRTSSGNTKWIRTIAKSEFLDGQCVRVSGSFQDITERVESFQHLEQKTRFLKALATINNNLLEVEEISTSIDKCLSIAGQTVDSDRTYYFENSIDQTTGGLLCSQRYEWAKNSVTPQINNPELQNVPYEALGETLMSLHKNLPFKAIIKDLEDGPTKEILASQDILSILIIPIFIGSNFVGFIGFDDCTLSREWTQDEEDFLNSIADTLTNALVRYNSSKELNETLNEKETILDSIKDGFFALDTDDMITSWNPRATEISTIDAEYAIGNHLWKVVDHDIWEVFESMKPAGVTTPDRLSFEYYHEALDKYLEIDVYNYAQGTSVFFRDITARKVAEIAIIKSEEKYRALIESSNSAIMMFDKAGRFEYTNDVANKYLDALKITDRSDLSISDVLNPAEAKQILGYVLEVFENADGKSIEQQLTLGQRQLWVRGSFQPVFKDHNVVASVMVSANDITPQKEAQIQIAESEERYRYLFEASPYALMLLEGDKIKEINDTALSLFEYRKEELINQSPTFISPPVQLDGTKSSSLSEKINKHMKENDSMEFDWLHQRKNGSLFVAQVNLTKSTLGDREVIFAMLQDRTDTLEAENQMMQFKQMAEQANYGTILVSKGVIRYCNDAFAKMHQFSKDELIGSNLLALDDQEAMGKTVTQKILEKIKTTGELKNTEIIRLRKDGSSFPVLVNLKAITTNHGEEIWALSVIDLTENKRIEQENKQLNLAIAQSPTAMILTDLNTTIEYVSPSFTSITGYTTDESIGQNITMLKEDMRNDPNYQTIWNTISSGESWQGEVINHKKGGAEIWVKLSITPIFNDLGIRTNYLILMNDITDSKNYEITLSQVNEKLRYSNSELEQFAYVASHDLQEPLGTISTYLSLLERKYKDSLDEKGNTFINFAVEGAARMRKIIKDLLEFSRVGRINQELEILDMNEILEEVIAFQKNFIAEKGAKIQYKNLPDNLYSYYVPLMQIMNNLVSNALKYSKTDEPPVISITHKELKDQWRFTVADNGKGIDPNYHDKIFEVFQRLEETQTVSGTGMGLAIVKKQIEHLGGTIKVKSEKGKGSSFIFTIRKIRNHK